MEAGGRSGEAKKSRQRKSSAFALAGDKQELLMLPPGGKQVLARTMSSVVRGVSPCRISTAQRRRTTRRC